MAGFVRLLLLAPLLLAHLPARAQGDPFSDVPAGHWAYGAVESLRARGLLQGYPNGSFRGSRTLTRYELAVALSSALAALQAAPRGGLPGPPGPDGPQGPAGPPGTPVASEDVGNLRRLLDEFRSELTLAGVRVGEAAKRLDALEREAADLGEQVRRMPTVYGMAALYVRGDESDGRYVDADGRVNGAGSAGGSRPLGGAVAVTDLTLGLRLPLRRGSSLDAAIASTGYKEFLGGTFSEVRPLERRAPSDVYLRRLALTLPLGPDAERSSLVIGRFGFRLRPLTLWRPDLDSYFASPWEDDGEYLVDGLRAAGSVGRLDVAAFAGRFGTVQGTRGGPINLPLAGTAAGAAGTTLFVGGQRPMRQPDQGQMRADLFGGITVGRSFADGPNAFGIGATALDLGTGAAGTRGEGFSNVLVLGAHADAALARRYRLRFDWARTIMGTGLGAQVESRNTAAFDFAADWGSGPLTIGTGYRYIEPHFYSPGYWGRLGSWFNPNNIQGPTVRVAYDFSRAVGVRYAEEFYWAVRDLAAQGGIGRNDFVNRIRVGIWWKPCAPTLLSADWEGVRPKYAGRHSGLPLLGAGFVHSPENHVTLAATHRLAERMRLRLAYHVGSFYGKGSVFTPAGTRYNDNVWTLQTDTSF